MEETLVSASTIVWLAFAIGAVFGLVAHRTNFCTMGAVSDIVNMGDWNRMRMWALAIAIAILGTGALQWLGLFDARNLATSLVLSPLAPVGIALGVFLMRRTSEVLFYRIAYSLLLLVGFKLAWDGIAAL